MITHDYSFWASQNTFLFSKCLKQFFILKSSKSIQIVWAKSKSKMKNDLGTADMKTWCNNRWMMRRLGLLIQYRIWRHGDGLAVTGNGGLLELRARVHCTTDICFTPHFLAITNSPPQWLPRGARLPTQNSTVSWELGEGEETSTGFRGLGTHQGVAARAAQRPETTWPVGRAGAVTHQYWGSAEETKYRNNTE